MFRHHFTLPEYKYTNANDHVRYERADGRHVNELVEVEYGRQDACGFITSENIIRCLTFTFTGFAND